MYVRKACEWCGKEYKPKTLWQRFCCDRCGRQWRKEYGFKHTYVCQHCGETYKAKVRDRNKYCSRECAFAHRGEIAELHRQGMGKRCPIHYTVCAQCGQPFMARRKGLKRCSDECQKAHARECYASYATEKKGHKERVCQFCGETFIAPYGDKRKRFCSIDCSRKDWRREYPEQKIIDRHRRRARKYGNGRVQKINPFEVYERDAWRCGICGKPVDPELEFPHPYSASLDHIQPLAAGGTHAYANVQLAHLICNSYKGASGGGQLRLGLEIDITRGV